MGELDDARLAEFDADPHQFIEPILVVPFVTTFTSADLPTALLTHGVALCLGFAFLLQPSEAGA